MRAVQRCALNTYLQDNGVLVDDAARRLGFREESFGVQAFRLGLGLGLEAQIPLRA